MKNTTCRFQTASVLSLLVAGVLLLTAPAHAQTPLQVHMNEATILKIDAYTKAAIADTSIADLAPLSDTELSVIGKKAGATTLAIVFKDEKPTAVYRVEVVNETTVVTLTKLIGKPGITVRTVGEAIVLEGQIGDEIEAQRIVQIAGAFKMPVVNLIEIQKPRQIQIRTKVAEVSSEAVKSVGFRWFGPAGDVQFAVDWNNKTGWIMGTVQPQSSSGESPRDALRGDLGADLMLQLLETKGYAKLLAEPTLLTYSGQEASFLVGQEVPIVQQLPQSFNVEYKEVGIRMKIKPTADSNNRINTKIQSEVSQIIGFEQQFGIPIIGSKKAESVLQVNDGQTIVIGGLLENNVDRDILRKVPWMADIPIFGLLFRNKSKKQSQREIIFFMTPEVVKDVDANTKDGSRTPIMQQWLKDFNPKDVLVVPDPKNDWSLANPGRMGWPEPKETPATAPSNIPDTPEAPKEPTTNFVPSRPAQP